MSKPRTYTEAAEKSMRYHFYEPIAASVFAELQAERTVSFALAKALAEILDRAGYNQGEWKEARAALAMYLKGQ